MANKCSEIICDEKATGYGTITKTKQFAQFCDTHGYKAMKDWTIPKFHRDKKAPRV